MVMPRVCVWMAPRPSASNPIDASMAPATAPTKLADVLEMQPPQGLGEKIRGLQKLKSIADSRPKTVRRAPSQDVVLEGDDASLDLLPIQTCWPDDAAPFITLPAVITKDPRTGTRNVGMYRMQKLGPRATAMHWQIHKDGRADYLATDGRIEVAVAFIALLELRKQNEIAIAQAAPFAPIRISRADAERSLSWNVRSA